MKLSGSIVVCSCHSQCDPGMCVMVACEGFGAVRFLGTQDKGTYHLYGRRTGDRKRE